MKLRGLAALAPLVASLLACGNAPDAAHAAPERIGTTSAAVSTASIVSIALANVGEGACSTNSGGSSAFDSSCTGNGGQPEYWCADFARWVWEQAGASDTSELTAAAGSFYVYGQNHGTLHSTPSLGDAVVFDYAGGGVADHVALVTQVNADGTIETVSGDWNGQSGSEATFSSTSSVVLNTPAYAATEGTAPAVMGMTISGYVTAVGASSTPFYAAAYMSQSFPLASSALHMVAGQTLPQTLTLKNTGTIAWDSNTHLGTTQPRDRDSVFADSTWISADRPAGVTGTVAPGDSFTFTFDFHAPSTPGTYFEYFNLVEEGVAWFSDPGQGGPVDDDLEAQIVVAAAPPGTVTDDDAGSGGGESSGPGAGGEDAGAPAAPAPIVTAGEDGGVAATSATPTTGAGVAAGQTGQTPQSGESSSGCSVTRGTTSGTAGYAIAALGIVALGLRRRRGRSPI
jgi:MYXO-CTERM domain-containing protein